MERNKASDITSSQPTMSSLQFSKKDSPKVRQDVLAWFISLIFIVVFIGAMFAWGTAVGWDAQSGYHYNDSNSTMERFLPEPRQCNETSIPGRSGKGCAAAWYFWKLPPDQVTAATRALVWFAYCFHQVFVWGLIYRAQLVKAFGKEKGKQKYGSKLSFYNWALLLVNALFHVLHLVQSHLTYDATAQDVSISSSQGSVVMMLCFILLIEYRDRGILMMWPNPRSDDRVARKVRLNQGPINLIRKYHGFAFAWASVYTFWYHPMENTWAHAMGFFHTAIVMLQGSLIFTEMHLNRYWRLLNEVWVLLHATVTAFQTSNPDKLGGSSVWPIFAFGFGFIFAFTQIFSFSFWRRISAWFRIIPIIVYFSVISALCATVVQGENGASGFSRMYQMIFIPAEEYMMFFFSWFFLFVFIMLERVIIGGRKKDDNAETSATKQALYVCGVVIIYALMIMISYLMRFTPGNLSVLRIIFVSIFTFGVCISIMFFKQIMGPFLRRRKSPHADCDGEGFTSNDIALKEASTSNVTTITGNNMVSDLSDDANKQAQDNFGYDGSHDLNEKTNHLYFPLLYFFPDFVALLTIP